MTRQLTPDYVAPRLSSVCPFKAVHGIVENSLLPNIIDPLIHSQRGVQEMLDTLYWSMLDETE